MHRTSKITLLAAALLALVGAGSASAASTTQRADRIMRQATAQMAHESATGIDHDNLSVAELVGRYDAGERLYIRCGNQSMVSQALLAREGIRSRLVGAITKVGDVSDGHTFLEVWTGKHWIAYDPDGNRQFVDAEGRAIGAVKAVAMRPFHWRYIASDVYDELYPDYTYAELDQAADHAMGILGIQIRPGMQYGYIYRGTPFAVAKVQGFGILPPSWVPVGEKRWAKKTKGEK